MRYTLHILAFVDMKRKDKAEAFIARVFSGMSFENRGRNYNGKYLNTDHPWEFYGCRNYEMPDDQSALWDSLTFLKQGSHSLTIITGPNNNSYELILTGYAEDDDSLGLTHFLFGLWCGPGDPSF
jgi:hypothetical protein